MAAKCEGNLSVLGDRDANATFIQDYLDESQDIISRLDVKELEAVIVTLVRTRELGGRLFVLGVGGSAANASHAANDFRKLAGIETYAPTDNVSELTARANDEGWATIFEGWLRASHLRSRDCILVLSVGGGDVERNISPNIVAALKYAEAVGASTLAIVGRSTGFAAQFADACVVIPDVNPAHVTPHSESFQAVLWHLMVSHPALKMAPTKWESVR